MSYAVSMVGDPIAAEDIVQRVLETAWQNHSKYDGTYPLGAWLRGIAKNMVRRHWASSQREPVFVGLDSMEVLDHLFQESEAEARDEHIKISRMAALESCIEALSAKASKILRMKYFDRMKSKEIGSTLGRSANAVDNTLSRTRHNLLNCISLKMAGVSP